MSSRYLTPLPRLLATAVEQGLNRLLQHDTEATAQLTALQERVLGISLQGLNIDLFFTSDGQQFKVSLHNEGEPDTWIRGTPPALAGMGLSTRGTAARTATARPGAVQIQGDAELARAYQSFFSTLQPDWEEALAQRLGDVMGHRVATLIRQVRQWLKQMSRDGAAMTADYLKEESQLLVTREAMDQFLEAVDDVRDDVDRLAARITRLESSTA